MAKPKKKGEERPDFFALSYRWPAAWVFCAVLPWALLVVHRSHQSTNLPLFQFDLWFRFFPPVLSTPAAAWLRHALYLSEILLFVLVAAGLGRALLRRAFKVDGLNAFESLAFSYALGLAVVGYASWTLAAVQLFRPGAVFALSAAAAAAAAWFNRELFREPPALLRDARQLLKGSAWNIPLAACTLGVLGLIMFYALGPEIFYDTLVYHLGLPNIYRLEGGFTATPTNLYSGIPNHLQMVYGWVLFFHDETLAKMVHWSCMAGFLAAALGFGLRAKKPLIGWLGAFLFMTSPVAAFNALRAAVDVGASFATICAAYAAALWIFNEDRRAEWDGLWPVSAVCAGMTMGMKYTNGPLFAAFGLTFLALKVEKRRIWIYLGICLASLAPWGLRNLVLYGNPIFPYLHEVFQPAAEFPARWRALNADAWGRDWSVILQTALDTKRALLHPWYLSMEGVTEFDLLGCTYLALLPLIFVVKSATRRETSLWIGYFLGLWLLWWPFTAMPRFFLPGMAVLSLFIGAALSAMPDAVMRSALIAVLVSVGLNNFVHVNRSIEQSGYWNYLFGKMSKAEYLSKARVTYPAPYYKAARWIDANTPPDARILIFGGGRSYYLNRRLLTNSNVDVRLFPTLLMRAKDADALYADLKARGVTHLMFNFMWLARIQPERAMLTRENLSKLADFLARYTDVAYNDQDMQDPRWTMVSRLLVREQRIGNVLEHPLMVWYTHGRSIDETAAAAAAR